jgi:hypothetical protein
MISGSLLLSIYIFWSSLPFLILLTLYVFFLVWPLITIALAIQFVTYLILPDRSASIPEESYIPRFPPEVFSQIALHVSSRTDLARLAIASKSTYEAANSHLYRNIILDEHPSPHIPWFRRRLYRLHHCLTMDSALYVRYADFSYYSDINEAHLLAILQKCININSLSLPAIQEPIQSHFERRGVVIKQPVFLTVGLSLHTYSSVTSLTWTGPFIPFRGPMSYAGQDKLGLFKNLRSLKILFRSDPFASENGVKCMNIYPATMQSVQNLTEDLRIIASSCPLLEELILPFWETVYSLVEREIFESFTGLRKIKFLALDGPMKDIDYGRGFLKFVFKMSQIDIQVTFLNPWKSHLDIASLLDEIDLSSTEIRRLSLVSTLTFGPIGSSRNIWQGRTDILSRLEWITPKKELLEQQLTLKWPITMSQPPFIIPPIFTGIEFHFDTPVRRGDAGHFLEFRKLITETVEFPHLERIRIVMERIDAFYLAFPIFMQFYGNRVLTLHVERVLLGQRKRTETYWIRREWRIKREFSHIEEVVALEELWKDGIHVHPARLFERIISGLFFCGERKVREITCVFHDRYSRS